jgi:hypothetical protein
VLHNHLGRRGQIFPYFGSEVQPLSAVNAVELIPANNTSERIPAKIF